MSTKSCMAILGVMLASTALTIPATANAALKGNLGNIRPLSDWRIGQVKGPTADAPGYCASVNQFEKGIVLALAQNQDGDLSLAIDFARPHFRTGEVYPVSLKHGDGYTVKAKGLGVNGKSLVIQLGQDPVFLRAMAQEGHLMIGLPDVDMKVSLVTFEKSAEKLESCVDTLPRSPKTIQQVEAEPPVRAQEDENTKQAALSESDPVTETEKQPVTEQAQKQTETVIETADKTPVEAPTPAPSPPAPMKREAPEWGEITWNTKKQDTKAKKDILWNDPAPLAEKAQKPVSAADDQPTIDPARTETEFDKILQRIDREQAEMLAAEDEEMSSLVTELDGLIQASAGGQDSGQASENLARIEELQQKISQLIEEREAERKRANQLAEKLSDVQAEQEQAVIENDAAREQRIKTLDEAAAADKARPVMVLQDELLMRQRDLERQARAQAEEAEWLERRRLEVEKRLAEAEQKNPSQELAKQLEALRAENQQLKQAYSEAEEKIAALNERVQAETVQQADISDIDNEAIASRDLTDQLQNQEERLSTLSSQLDAKEGEINRLQKQARAQQQRDEVLQQEAALEAQDLQNRETRLETLREQLNDRENEIARLQDLLEQEKQQESQKQAQQDTDNLAVKEDAQRLAEQERQLTALNSKVERKRVELESLQTALTEQKQLQQDYQAQISHNPYAGEAPDITWNTRPEPQQAAKQPKPEAVQAARDADTDTTKLDDLPTTYIDSNTVPRRETADVKRPQSTAGTSAASEPQSQRGRDDYQRATDLVDELVEKYQPHAGRESTSDKLFLEGQVETVHHSAALSIYKNLSIKPTNTANGFFVQSIEPAAGAPAAQVDIKAQQADETGQNVLMQDVALTRSQVINSGLQQLLAKSDIQVGAYKDDMGYDGVGYQRNWATDGLNGQFALYEDMSSDRFMTYISNFLNAYTHKHCEGEPVKRLHMVSNDVVTAEVSCQDSNVFGGLVFFKDKTQSFSIVSHRGALDRAGQIQGMNAALSKRLLQDSERFQSLQGSDDLTLDDIFDSPSDTDSAEIQI